MTENFFLNNLFTHRQYRLKKWGLLKGLLTFYLACGLGMAVNLQIAYSLFHQGVIWWISGLLGAVVGAVWNYAITSTLTWKRALR